MPWLIIGLGNPGPEYESTPHNLGFLAVDRLAARHGIRITRLDSKAIAGVGTIGSEDVVIAKPQTFMNLSGTSVKPLAAKHGVETARVVVIYDDLDLPWTGVRIRPKGSAGGHHGVESVIKTLGSQEFPRIRLGINPGHPVRDGAQFVLAPMRKAWLQEMEELLDHTAAAVESIIAEGVEKAMTKYNRRARGLQKEEE